MNRGLPAVLLAAVLIAPALSQSAGKVGCGNSTVADFSPSLEPRANAFLASLKAAVKAQDKHKAGMVHYPLLVNMPKRHRRIKTTAQFVAELRRAIHNLHAEDHRGAGSSVPLRKLAGNNDLWQQIRAGKSEDEIRAGWEPQLSEFKKIRQKYLLYEDF